MPLRFAPNFGKVRGHWLAVVLLLGIAAFAAPAARAANTETNTASADRPAPERKMEREMGAGWFEGVVMRLEAEAMSDASMLPDAPAALAREWRSFARDGSAFGAFVSLCWVVLLAAFACLIELLVACGASYRVRRAIRSQPEGPRLSQLIRLLVCDGLGVAALSGAFIFGRHWPLSLGVGVPLVLLAGNVLLRWRIGMLIIRVVLRPWEPAARLVPGSDTEARRLYRFFSPTLLAVMVLIAFGRYGLADEDSGAPHVIGLIVATLVGALDAMMVYRARWAGEALISGMRRDDGVVAALRRAAARAWVPVGLTTVIALIVLFVFGLSLGLLSYFYAIVSSLGVLLVLLIMERLSERGWHASLGGDSETQPIDAVVARSGSRLLRSVILLGGATMLAWLWIDAIDLSPDDRARAMHSALATLAIVFASYIVWELFRLALERHVQPFNIGPRLPGADEDVEIARASRLQTMLPMLRAGFGAVISVLAALIVLSRLGVDTAPLIAGAGVFGLAISFGSQSLVRDIISGLFYMWDDAFRVGEYIDTGRLRGTVETLGIRSLKLRHHNGPLHTIPYGQLGAVTNLSRDYATTKFNLRLDRATDIELVRKTAKRIGLAMQDNPDIAAEVILPLKLQGIAEVADNALVLRFKFTARPIKPSWIQREYLKRIHAEFADKGIAFASGAVMLQTVEAKPPPAERPRPVPLEPADLTPGPATLGPPELSRPLPAGAAA